MPKTDTLYWFDATINTDSVISFILQKDALVVLNRKCNALIVKTVDGTTTFYFDNSLKLDKNFYGQHKYGNCSFFTSHTGALPLKTNIDTKVFRIESTAIQIIPMKLLESDFSIDSKTPTKKSS